ncbi:hypothetical protein MMC31_004030 [Peltigera leucophlebia]|nr:hypothetical protein [Peltigera leucophlebia]
MEKVEREFPLLCEPELHISKSEGKERSFAPMRGTKALARATRIPMRVTRARARATRTPMAEIRTPPRTEVITPIPQDEEVNEGSRLSPLAEVLNPFSGEPVPRPVYKLQLTRVTPVLEEGPKITFMDDRPELSPLILKLISLDEKNDDSDCGKLPTEFVLGPLPGPPAPKKRKLLVGTSRKRACGNPSPHPIHPQMGRVAPVKWAPPLRFPSTSTSPIRKISTEWDDDDDDEHESPPVEEITPPA